MVDTWDSGGDRAGGRRLLTGLNAEWHDLVRAAGTVPRTWTAERPCLVPPTGPDGTLADLLADGRHRDDAVLHALLALHHDGDELAGRTVLQACLGAVVRMAARDRGAGLGDYIAHLWCLIRTYPLARRPRKIANNLELDTLKAVRRERPRQQHVSASVEQLEQLLQREAVDDTDDPAAPAVIRAGVVGGFIDRTTATVLTTVYAEGLSGREAAARHAVSVDTIRWRCSRGVRALARHRATLADAA